MQIKIGIYSPPDSFLSDGWKMVCEQEKVPFTTRDCFDCPVVVWEGAPPDWLAEYMQKGGISIATGVRPGMLPFADNYVCEAALEYVDLTQLDSANARVGCVASIFAGQGLGLALHENRVAKYGIEPDVYPTFVFHSRDKGGCWYTGLPLSRLVTALGDNLRQTTDFCSFTERVVAVDKHHIIKAMRSMLIRALHQNGYPYVHLGYYPGDYRSAFAFRVDVDGVFGDNLENISTAAAQCGMRLSFYINKSQCQPEQERLRDIHSLHEIGNHADVHNLYTDYEDNLNNITACKQWLDSLDIPNGPWFVAPRGMWNFSLAQALWDAGYAYTSDFGYCIFGFPVYPYASGKRLPLLQIAIDPFSTERAVLQAREQGAKYPDADSVFHYFSRSIDVQYQAGSPIFLYSHPEHFGPMAAQVLPRIKEKIDALPVWQTTLTQFGNWWKRRDQAVYSAEYDLTSGKVHIVGGLDNDMCVQIINA